MKNIPRIRFAHLPTLVEPLPRLTAALDGPRLWVKRDDLTGLALGGNKTRKLEFLIAEAQANGARMLITAGAAQSNHCRQTAAAAAHFGYKCIVVLTGEPATPSGNLLLDKLFGAEIVWANRAEREQVLRQTFESAWEAGNRPYLIPYGGSNPTGAAGYVFALKELLDQISEVALNQPPDWIIIPSSSGGTQAGLALGARLFGYKGKILGISVDEIQQVLQERVASLANATAENLGEAGNLSPEDILVNANYLGEGYGVMGKPEKEALTLFATHEGLLLDPVYTGRAAAGMIDLIRGGYFSSHETILFWHTGGTAALFADSYRTLVDNQ